MKSNGVLYRHFGKKGIKTVKIWNLYTEQGRFEAKSGKWTKKLLYKTRKNNDDLQGVFLKKGQKRVEKSLINDDLYEKGQKWVEKF